jgi:hypothetical protein
VSDQEYQDTALILTICVAGGALLMAGWFVWTYLVPAFMAAVFD